MDSTWVTKPILNSLTSLDNRTQILKFWIWQRPGYHVLQFYDCNLQLNYVTSSTHSAHWQDACSGSGKWNMQRYSQISPIHIQQIKRKISLRYELDGWLRFSLTLDSVINLQKNLSQLRCMWYNRWKVKWSAFHRWRNATAVLDPTFSLCSSSANLGTYSIHFSNLLFQHAHYIHMNLERNERLASMEKWDIFIWENWKY